jgi:hypothetical protein
METDERPDLFDIKFLRDELLYYSRDENQFLRRRRGFVFALYPDLAGARYKDPGLPYQRGVLLLALLVMAVRKLSEWLSTDALHFEVLFVCPADVNPVPLAAEWELLRTLLPEPIANGLLHLRRATAAEVPRRVAELARRNSVHCLIAAADPPPLRVRDAVVTRLQVAGARAALADGAETPAVVEGEEPVDSWGAALEQVLARWI